MAYKTVKGILEFGLAGVLAGMIRLGLARSVQHLATTLRDHVSGVWSNHLAERLVQAATPRKVELTCIALVLDGILTFVEGGALWKGHWWAPWLVVTATGMLLPLELYELVIHFRIGRLAVFTVNLVIVLYLAQQALRESRAHRTGIHRSDTE